MKREYTAEEQRRTRLRALWGLGGVLVIVAVISVIGGLEANDGSGQQSVADAQANIGGSTGGPPAAAVKHAGTASCYVVRGEVSKYNDMLDGIRAATLTSDDEAGDLGSIASKLNEAISFGGPGDYVSLLTDAATKAGQGRVFILDGTPDDADLDTDAIGSDLTDAAPYCN